MSTALMYALLMSRVTCVSFFGSDPQKTPEPICAIAEVRGVRQADRQLEVEHLFAPRRDDRFNLSRAVLAVG